MSSTKKTVLTAAAELFGKKDPSAVDRWVAAARGADRPPALVALTPTASSPSTGTP
ncbi:hypothetical protein [Streptomyces sp. NPDC057002]|uniref:hypothetical protein n=1 Tax=Streptomyces sp. NPDC057002 TaxID=3345992 RepID=UPI00362930E9